MSLALPTPTLIIKPRPGWQRLQIAEIWQFRDLLATLAVRDVKLRYRQTAVGALWVVLQPLLAAGIFSFVFGRVARLPSDGVPYFLFSFAGLLAWNAFSNTLTKASSSLVGNAGLVSKIYFPRLILPLSILFSTVIDFSVALGLMFVLMAVNGVAPGLSLLLLPVWLFLLLTLSMGLALFAAALMVSYRDVQYILPVATQFLLYASPVAYSVSAIPSHLQFFYFLNPVAGLLEAFRWSLLNRGTLHPGAIVYTAVFSFAALFVGALYFQRMERRFADVI